MSKKKLLKQTRQLLAEIHGMMRSGEAKSPFNSHWRDHLPTNWQVGEKVKQPKVKQPKGNKSLENTTAVN